MVAVAVKVKALFAQPGLEPLVKAIEIDGVTVAVLFIVILFEVAVVLVAQVSLDVNTQVTASAFTKAVDVKVERFVPAFIPFTFH